ncbi:MAG: YlxR family protein [bacterium]|nr:YlxR family protein [bacterium]
MAAKAQAPRPKHVPRRMCVSCRQGESKRALVRIVRTPAGSVLLDVTGKMPGRGAYLCRSRACWQLASKKRILEHALHTPLQPEEKAALEEFSATLSD